MPPPITPIENAEELIRSVSEQPGFHTVDPVTGALKLSSSAFNDPKSQPSVDRRSMLTSLDAAKRGPSHGLVKVVAHEVRAIGIEMVDKDGGATGEFYKIDALHRPVEQGNPDNLAPNPAHSQVESAPALTSSRFRKLKERLAQIANRHGWVRPPGPPKS